MSTSQLYLRVKRCVGKKTQEDQRGHAGRYKKKKVRTGNLTVY